MAAVAKYQVAKPTIAAPDLTPPISYQEASALAIYGGSDPADKSALALSAPQINEQALSPSLPLPLGVAVIGHTITPYNSISKGANQGASDLSVSLDQPIQLSQGYSLPVGTVVQFTITVADNGLVQATSKGIYINNSAIKVPSGSFSITGTNNEALVAQQRAMRQDELASADTRTAFYGAVGNVGQVLTQAGNQTVIGSIGIGTVSGIQTNSSSPNILAAAAQGAFQPLLAANQARTATVTAEIQGLSRINTLPINMKVKVFVTAPGVVQIPVAGGQTTFAEAPPATQENSSAMEVKPASPKANYADLQPTKSKQTPEIQPKANSRQDIYPELANPKPQQAVYPDLTTPQLQQVAYPELTTPQPSQPVVPDLTTPQLSQPVTPQITTPQPQQPIAPQVTTPQPQQPIYMELISPQQKHTYPQAITPRPQRAAYPQSIALD
jgi:outer membrane lipoprotein SlyB